MSATIDRTHDPARRSWVASANDGATDFPIQNLPLGVFSRAGGSDRRIGVAIGDSILDLHAASGSGLLAAGIDTALTTAPSLDALFAAGPSVMQRLREAVGDVLDAAADGSHRDSILHPMAACRMHLPTAVRNYTDFYAGIHHARAIGALLQPENPLPANYKWVPIAYHGRASSVQVGGAPVRRPNGQRAPAAGDARPGFGPSTRLDIELEMAFYVGQGNAQGSPVPVAEAASHIAGFALLNDWSARDVQQWEMFPLGPFLGKSFATSVSPWVVTAQALAPFRAPAMVRPDGDPAPLPYLQADADQRCGGLDIKLDVSLATKRMQDEGQPPLSIIKSNSRYLYWTPAQMLAHHTVNGCNLEPGDLIGTGTISGPTRSELSSLLELTVGGSHPVTLPNGERRTFIEDGDEITLRGRCEREGFVPIGFGACVGTVMPALEMR